MCNECNYTHDEPENSKMSVKSIGTVEHTHAPYGGVETYPYAKIGKCACGVDMVSYAAEITAAHNWNEWEVTALGDPCLSCGGYNTPSCCEVEE